MQFPLSVTSVAVATACVGCWWQAAWAANGAAPYSAVVTAPTADVYSGPGANYYRTAELQRGDRVEVHHNAGGFLGVRPPADSFSWVNGGDLKQIADGIAEVTRDGVPSRVGSGLAEDRNVVHIRLHRGERVRVLARVMIDGVEWAQIAPPAGEFRWIRAEAIKPQQAIALDRAPDDRAPVVAATADEATPNANESTTVEAREASEAPVAIEDPAATPEVSPQVNEWVQVASHNLAPAAPAPPSATPSSATPPPAPPSPAPQTTTTPKAPASAVPQSPPTTGGGFYDQLSALEIELSRRVTEATNLWRLDDIGVSASRLLSSARDPQQKAAARALAMRADRFAAIAKRHRQLRGVAPDVGLTRSRVAAAPSALTPRTTFPQSATGELRTVVSKRPGAPRFALVDPQGTVTTFLTPQPGMDIQPLVGKQVTVSGVQGYLPGIQRQHIAASRVALLTR